MRSSATAFIVITKMDATAAKPRSPSLPEAAEPKPAPGKPTPPAPAPTAPKLTVATLKPPAGAASPARRPPMIITTTPTPAPAQKEGEAATPLPNWKGKRLSVARREARKLGLDVTAVDESGETIPSDMLSAYRVRRQLEQMGAAVRFVAREIVDTVDGY